MIVVTSTAKNAVGLAGRCVASVRAAAPGGYVYPPGDDCNVRVRHVFYAADMPTLRDACAGADCLEVQLERPGMCSLANLLEVWSECDPSDIIVHLDGDDRLASADALARVAHMYARDDTWLTYGSFVCDDGTRDWDWHKHFGRRYRPGGNPRHEPWRASHLKTFRAGLVQRVPRAYLERPDGGLYDTCLDLAVMFPMLDMAGENYIACTDVLHTYTRSHSFQANAPAQALETEARDRAHICARAPLACLTERPW